MCLSSCERTYTCVRKRGYHQMQVAYWRCQSVNEIARPKACRQSGDTCRTERTLSSTEQFTSHTMHWMPTEARLFVARVVWQESILRTRVEKQVCKNTVLLQRRYICKFDAYSFHADRRTVKAHAKSVLLHCCTYNYQCVCPFTHPWRWWSVTKRQTVTPAATRWTLPGIIFIQLCALWMKLSCVILQEKRSKRKRFPKQVVAGTS